MQQLRKNKKIMDAIYYGIIIARWPYDTLLSYGAIRALRMQYDRENPDTLPKLVDLCFNFNYHGIRITPYQVKSEITELLGIIKDLKPCRILEIGTAKGGTLFLFSKVLPDNAEIFSIDRGMPFETFFRRWRVRFFESFVKHKNNMHILQLNSHSKSTFERLKKMLSGKKFDFLFIDGDHTYIGAKKDFEMYSKLVKKGGIIAMHDVALHPPEKNCNVYKFFNELQKKHRTKKIIENTKQGWGGIGILKV